MKSLAGSVGVVFCGLVSSVLVAIINVVLANATGFNLFTFAFWFILPIGAGLSGFAAASGYYFGSVYFHKRATRALMIQMVLIAGLTQALIYYLGYVTAQFDDGQKIADVVSFSRYLDAALTSVHYQVGGQHDLGEAGAWGYLIAAIHFLGFLVGGVCVYAFLQSKPVCEACNLYLRTLAKKEKIFASSEAASAYYDRVFTVPLDSQEFISLIQTNATVATPHTGNLKIKTVLHGCPDCQEQLVTDTVAGYDGSEWQAMNDLERRTRIPQGVDLAPTFCSR
jgi:hypothetical protein